MKSANYNKKEFATLIQDNQGLIHKVTFVYADNPVDREDLFQEICLQLWKSNSLFRKESKFSTWAYRIALNTAINYLRKKKRSIKYEKLNDSHQFTLPSSGENEELGLMYAAISNLNRIDKAIIFLWLEEKNYDEISEITGISKSNVSVKLVRIKRKLQEMILTKTKMNHGR